LFLAAFLCTTTLCAAQSNCPYVFDGNMFQFDLNTQTSIREMSANWYGLTERQVVSYDWAIISEKLATPAILNDGCRFASGISGLPDVAQWESTRMRTLVTKSDLKLQVGTTYYVLIRTTLIDGTLLFSNSNGVRIVAAAQEAVFTAPKDTPVLLSGSVAQAKNKIFSKQARSYVTDSCTIDEDNRCRQVTQINAVGEYLNNVYGPPVWFQTSQSGILYRIPTTAAIAEEIGIPGFVGVFAGSNEAYFVATSNSSSSSDEGLYLSPGGIVAIAVAVPVGSGLALLGIVLIVLFILLLIVVLVVLICFLLKPKKFEENYQTKTNDVVDSDIGRRTEVTMSDSNTRVEFPDLDAPS